MKEQGLTIPPCALAAGELSQAVHPSPQCAAIRDAPDPILSIAVTFSDCWSPEPSLVQRAGDTVATVKDLSGHDAAAESALQAPGEELLYLS